MKKITQSCLNNLCRLVAIIWPYNTLDRFQKIKTKLHTFWIASELKSLGENSSIGYPIVLKGGKYISIGKQSDLGKRGILTAWDNYMGDIFIPEISIGNNTSIGEDYHITAINKIQIGSNVLMGKKITITDNAHGKTDIESISKPPVRRALYSKGPVIIEDGVWIGEKVTILPGVIIGCNSIVGANSLVTKDIPANCVVGGIPAILIKNII